jgi:hypothetical protein
LETASDRVVHAALSAALSQQARASAQREQAARLREGLEGIEQVELPYLIADALGPAQLGGLADELEALL